MKNLKTIATLLFFFILNIGFCQEKEIHKPDWKINNRSVLYILNGQPVTQEVNQKISADNIENINVIKEDKALAMYGEKGQNGVIIIQTQDIPEETIKELQKLYAYEFHSNEKEQKMNISGIITDCEGLEIPVVKITNLNSKKTFQSGMDGKYKLIAHQNDVLEYVLLGFESQRIVVQKRHEINVKLKISNTNSEGNIMVKKPIIYLYPTQKTDITFTFDFKGKLLTTFPKYDQQWNVTAYPDGKIFDKKTNRFYASLFWDGEQNFPKEHYAYKEGFVVSKNNLTDFLIEKLEYIGLNHLETNDFVQYWLPILEKNQLNFIHFRVNKEYDVISKNNVNPVPDTSIRIFMDFYALDKSITIPEQVLQKTERKGFTLVEWGGSDISNSMKKSYAF